MQAPAGRCCHAQAGERAGISSPQQEGGEQSGLRKGLPSCWECAELRLAGSACLHLPLAAAQRPQSGGLAARCQVITRVPR